MNEQKTNQLFVFQRKDMGGEEPDKFELKKNVQLKEIPVFEKVCMNFHFKKSDKGSPQDTIIFAKKDQIFELNYETE